MVVTKRVTGEVTLVEIPQEIEKQLLSVEMLPVEQLIIDHTYQRPMDESRVRQMSANWNWLGCGTLAVSLRTDTNGKNTYSVIDGQQRLAAIKEQGFKEAPCRIYVDLTQTQEAELFELLNKNKKPGFNDLFKSRLMRGEQVAHAIELACKQVGYSLDVDKRHHGPQAKDTHYWIQTMPELERIYKRGGVMLIIDTLKLIRDLYAPDFIEQQQMALAGCSLFVQRYLSKCKRSELISKVKKEGQFKICQKAFQWLAVHGNSGSTGGRATAYSEVLLTIYNQNRQETNRIKSRI